MRRASSSSSGEWSFQEGGEVSPEGSEDISCTGEGVPSRVGRMLAEGGEGISGRLGTVLRK